VVRVVRHKTRFKNVYSTRHVTSDLAAGLTLHECRIDPVFFFQNSKLGSRCGRKTCF
jgi:hypothetical protein